MIYCGTVGTLFAEGGFSFKLKGVFVNSFSVNSDELLMMTAYETRLPLQYDQFDSPHPPLATRLCSLVTSFK